MVQYRAMHQLGTHYHIIFYVHTHNPTPCTVLLTFWLRLEYPLEGGQAQVWEQVEGEEWSLPVWAWPELSVGGP